MNQNSRTENALRGAEDEAGRQRERAEKAEAERDEYKLQWLDASDSYQTTIKRAQDAERWRETYRKEVEQAEARAERLRAVVKAGKDPCPCSRIIADVEASNMGATPTSHDMRCGVRTTLEALQTGDLDA